MTQNYQAVPMLSYPQMQGRYMQPSQSLSYAPNQHSAPQQPIPQQGVVFEGQQIVFRRACPNCGDIGSPTIKKTRGAANHCWCKWLYKYSFWMWMIPYCCDCCRDTQEVCKKCGTVKHTTPGNYCCFM